MLLTVPLSQSDYKSLISYFLKEGFYQHAVDEATEQIHRRGNDTYLLYWKGNSTPGPLLQIFNCRTGRVFWVPTRSVRSHKQVVCIYLCRQMMKTICTLRSTMYTVPGIVLEKCDRQYLSGARVSSFCATNSNTSASAHGGRRYLLHTPSPKLYFVFNLCAEQRTCSSAPFLFTVQQVSTSPPPSLCQISVSKLAHVTAIFCNKQSQYLIPLPLLRRKGFDHWKCVRPAASRLPMKY